MKILKKLGDDLVPLSRRQHSLLFLIVALVFQFIFFALPSLADEINTKTARAEGDLTIKGDSLTKSDQLDMVIEQAIQKSLDSQKEYDTEVKEEIKVISSSVRRLSAYNSEAGQTDNSPCITANGFNVCEHGQEDTIAANFLSFGTKVRIPELFGDRIFVVRDRMHSKNGQKVDIWMKNRSDALKFGVKVAKIEVLE
ncbi:MAG: hypothetical protein WC441_04150 [Patescibacteria group bacterium]